MRAKIFGSGGRGSAGGGGLARGILRWEWVKRVRNLLAIPRPHCILGVSSNLRTGKREFRMVGIGNVGWMKRRGGLAGFGRRGVAALLAAAACGAGQGAMGAINIRLDYTFDTQNFFNTPQKKAVVEMAADLVGNMLDDSLLGISSGATGNWTARFSHPGMGALLPTPTLQDVPNLVVQPNEIVIYMGGQNLMGAALAIGGKGGFGISGAQQSFIDLVFSRGEGDGTRNSVSNPTVAMKTAFDFGPWGGAITFDNSATWNFQIGGPAAGQNDVFSVMLHELGHVLGVGTADSFKNKVDSMTGTFTGPHTVGVCDCPVAMSGASHLALNTMGHVNGVEQEAAMDPNLTVGTRKLLTDFDTALLRDIGWEISTPLVVDGDVDGDGRVDGFDYQTLRFNFRRPGNRSLLEGDFDGDLDVDIFDFMAMQANFGAIDGQGAGGGAALTIPEPSAGMLLMMGAWGVWRRGRATARGQGGVSYMNLAAYEQTHEAAGDSTPSARPDGGGSIRWTSCIV